MYMALRTKLGFLILLTLIVSSCGWKLTDYTRPDIPELFAKVKEGDSLQEVYQILGKPFVIDLIEYPSTTNQVDRSGRLRSVVLEEVAEIASGTGGWLCLEYSRPKPKSELYSRYQVVIKGGKAVRIDRDVVID
jgi:hypothetical protein